MKNIATLLILSISFIISSCGRVFYYSHDCPNDDYVTINSKSKMFIRKGYLDATTNFKTTDSISGNVLNKLIEIQYLIINPNDEVIYISTTPSRYIYDKTNNYLIKSKRNEYPNAFYLNTFSFGKLIPSEDENYSIVEFSDRKKAFDWKFRIIDKDNYELESVNGFKFRKIYFNGKKEIKKVYQTTESSESSTASKKIFTKINHFIYLSFKIPDDSTTSEKIQEEPKLDSYTSKIYNKQCILIDSITKYKQYPKATTLNFKYKNNKIKYLYIPFNMNIFDGYRSIKFKKNRIAYKLQMED